MSIKTRIADGAGTEVEAKVDPSRALCVIQNPFPPYEVEGGMRIFRQYFTDDGTSTGTSDMRVDGSSTNQIFYIPAHETKDRYLTMLSFEVSDASAALNNFGNITALTNGVQLAYEDEEGEVLIHDAIKSNWNLIRLCLGTPPKGATTNAFRASNVSGASEGYTPFLDLRKTFGFQWGIKLAAGTNQRMLIRIRDDVTTIDSFDCIAYGFDRKDTGVL